MISQAGLLQLRIPLFKKFMALGPAGDIGKGYQGADYNKNNKSQKTAETSSYLLKMKGISKEIVETSKKIDINQ